MSKSKKNLIVIIISILGILIILSILGYSFWSNKKEKERENKEGTQGEITREKKEESQEVAKTEEKQDISKKTKETGSEETKKAKEETEEKTKDWQVYENKLYKYKVKYPENWFSGPENKEDSWIIYFLNHKIEKMNEIDLVEGVKVEILVQGNPRNLSLVDWVNEGHIFSGDPKNSQEIEVSGLKAIREEVDFEGMTTIVYFFQGDNVFTISYSGAEADYNKNKGNFDLMIGSFEIVNTD